MKKTTISVLRFAVLFGLTGGLVNVAQAQQTPKSGKAGDVRVKIIERSGDTVTEFDRTYRADAMTDAKRDDVVKNLVDSLKTARKGDSRQRQLTIIIDNDTDGNRIVTKERRYKQPLPRLSGPGARPGATDLFKGRDFYGGDGPLNSNRFRYQFRADIDSVSDRLNRLNFNFPQDLSMRLAQPFEAWSRDFTTKAPTVRSLEAYPNNPDHNLLTVRFTAPAKGDISIVVTNPKGKEVARKDVKDFMGEFVGQIDLGKNATGVYFMTVTQNDDGAVKRIVVK